MSDYSSYGAIFISGTVAGTAGQALMHRGLGKGAVMGGVGAGIALLAGCKLYEWMNSDTFTDESFYRKRKNLTRAAMASVVYLIGSRAGPLAGVFPRVGGIPLTLLYMFIVGVVADFANNSIEPMLTGWFSDDKPATKPAAGPTKGG